MLLHNSTDNALSVEDHWCEIKTFNRVTDPRQSVAKSRQTAKFPPQNHKKHSQRRHAHRRFCSKCKLQVAISDCNVSCTDRLYSTLHCHAHCNCIKSTTCTSFRLDPLLLIHSSFLWCLQHFLLNSCNTPHFHQCCLSLEATSSNNPHSCHFQFQIAPTEPPSSGGLSESVRGISQLQPAAAYHKFPPPAPLALQSYILSLTTMPLHFLPLPQISSWLNPHAKYN